MLRGPRIAVASLALALAFACTKKNPKYCAMDSDCPSRSCNTTLNACNPSDGGVADAHDGGDARDGGDAGDAGDAGDGGDARDASDAGDGPYKCKKADDCVFDGGGFDGSTSTVCEVEAGACVECLADKDCTATAKPICNLTSRTCGPCTTDAQCASKDPSGPGVCMFHQDGRCATDAETIYVKNTTPGCSMTPGAGGTKDVPYCLSQDAINVVTATRSLLVMRGPDALTEWAVATAPAASISVIGQSGAVVSPGARIGIHLSAGTTYVRGLKISGGSSTGVVADNSAVLKMDGCIVESNVLGGIKVDGASFDITNTVIAKNMSTSTAGCGAWAGACFNSVTGTPRFLNNTVVSNVGTGTACNNGATTVAGSIEFGNTPDNSLCTVTSCCSGNPMLTADYHLMSTSTCIDQLDPAMSTTHDFDGQLRPRGTAALSDCGADEF